MIGPISLELCQKKGPLAFEYIQECHEYIIRSRGNASNVEPIRQNHAYPANSPTYHVPSTAVVKKLEDSAVDVAFGCTGGLLWVGRKHEHHQEGIGLIHQFSQ
jgi:hypothetical protein